VPSGVERAFPEELSADVREQPCLRRRHGRALHWSAYKEGICVGGGCAGHFAEARGAGVRCCLRVL
jgi:hypothetical protein